MRRSLRGQLNAVQSRIRRVIESMPPPPEGTEWDPVGQMDRLKAAGEYSELLRRVTGLLRRIRYSERRQSEDAWHAALLIFHGRGHAFLHACHDLFLKDESLAIELAQASGARLAKLVRVHLMPVAEQASLRVPRPWQIPPSVAEATATPEAAVVHPPASKATDRPVEKLPALPDAHESAHPVRAAPRNARRRRASA